MDLSNLLGDNSKLLLAYVVLNSILSGVKIALDGLQDAGVISKENKMVSIISKIADILSGNVAHKK